MEGYKTKKPTNQHTRKIKASSSLCLSQVNDELERKRKTKVTDPAPSTKSKTQLEQQQCINNNGNIDTERYALISSHFSLLHHSRLNLFDCILHCIRS